MTFLSWSRIIIFVALLILALAVGLGDKDPSASAMAPQHILSLLRVHCNKVGGGYPPGNDKPATPSVCELRGAVYWKTGMTIDCDGIITIQCGPTTDPDFTGDTELHDSRDRPLDAAHLPYVVAPFPDEHWDYTKNGVDLGAPVAVIYNGRLRCGVLGDVGTMGEASYAMAQSLGIDPDPRQGGTYSEVTYIIFEHSRISPAEDHAKAVDLCMARLAEFVQLSEQ